MVAFPAIPAKFSFSKRHIHQTSLSPGLSVTFRTESGITEQHFQPSAKEVVFGLLSTNFMNRRVLSTFAFLLLFVVPDTGMPVYAMALTRVDLEIDRQGKLIRLTGQLLESNSGRAIGNASIMVQCADLVLAHKQTDNNGNFVLLIPEEKISEDRITLKIRYREHIFTRENLLPISQDLQVEINRAILLDTNPVEDYRIPLHDLNDPTNGQVLIRTHYAGPMIERSRKVRI